MKKIALTIALFFACITPSFAGGDWHDDLISSMNSDKNVERSLAVDRDPNSGKIKQATYRYSFKNKSLYKALRAKLINREHEAANFILRPGEDGAILMKCNSDDGFRNYSLSHVKGKYHLIVSVNSSEPFGIGDNGSVWAQQSRDQAQRQAQLAREQAQRQAQLAREQAQRQAQLAREQAQRQAQLAREQAQRQREQAQRQAQLAREQAQRQAELAREQAQRAREQAQRQAELAREQAQRAREQAQRATTYKVRGYVTTMSETTTQESEDITKKLKAAEAERKKLLKNK